MPPFSAELLAVEDEANAEYLRYATTEGQRRAQKNRLCRQAQDRAVEKAGPTCSPRDAASGVGKRKRDCPGLESLSGVSNLRGGYRDRYAPLVVTSLVKSQKIAGDDISGCEPARRTPSPILTGNNYHGGFDGRTYLRGRERPKRFKHFESAETAAGRYAPDGIPIPGPIAASNIITDQSCIRPFVVNGDFVVSTTTDVPSFPAALPARNRTGDMHAHRRTVLAGNLGDCEDNGLEVDFVPSLNAEKWAVFDVVERGRGSLDTWMWDKTLFDEERAQVTARATVSGKAKRQKKDKMGATNHDSECEASDSSEECGK